MITCIPCPHHCAWVFLGHCSWPWTLHGCQIGLRPSLDISLGLRLLPVLPSLQDSSQHLGSGFGSISDPAFRSFNRQSQESQSSSLQAHCRLCKENLQAPIFVAGKSCMDMFDLFAGDGGVSFQCERKGYFSKQWDIRNGPLQDLTDPKVVQRLAREIQKGRVIAVMMSPVYTNFSRARDRTKVLRNHRFPWGIPQRCLSEHEKQNVSLGNACLRTCLKLIAELNARRIPWGARKSLEQSVFFLSRRPFCVEEMPVNGAPHGENPQFLIQSHFGFPSPSPAVLRSGWAVQQNRHTGVPWAKFTEPYAIL